MKKNQNIYLSFIRIVFCIAVLLYHLNILKGGYLAVNSFLVLSGYLATISLSKNHSLIKYYLKRLKKIYLPLLIVVFTTLSISTIFKANTNQMKSEITSILFGYNNYWQLNAKQDYFAKNINSPYLHFWYIAMLMQIELLYPLVFNVLKKIGKKTHKAIPLIILIVAFICSLLRFCYYALNNNIMFSYYDTLARLSPFILGALAGLYKIYTSKSLKPNKNKSTYFIYLILLFVLFITISASSNLYIPGMILSSFITIQLINHAIMINQTYTSKNIVNYLSNITYEVYLIHYPLIFFATFLNNSILSKSIVIVLIALLLSFIMHTILEKLSDKNNRLLHVLLFILMAVPSLFGSYIYANLSDNNKEAEELKIELENNRILMEQKQKEFFERQLQEKTKKEEAEWNNYINSLYKSSGDIEEYVSNLRVVGVGDSVMLDSIPGLYKEFPNGYFDAKVSRSTYAAYDVLKGIKESGIEWDILVFNLGTNGETYRKYKDNLMNLAGDHDVFWLTATTPDYPDSNEKLIEYAKEFDNIHILDWAEDVKEHPEYLYKDYTHLKPVGIKFYTQYIKDKIVNYYIEKQNKEIEEIIKNHEK